MLRVKLVAGAPDEPDAGDWDAICATPGPRGVFAQLFYDIAKFSLPEPKITEESEDDVHRVHIIWCGTNRLGVKVIEIESVETSAFPMYCTWETFGLPGIKMTWKYSLEKAGQLGYAAFRHGTLEANFETADDQKRFAEIWQQAIGKTPVFEPLD